jgi:hypothetical protein
MSESFIYSSGLGNVGSYQVSGVPFVTGGVNATSVTKISFPSVTRWVQIVNPGNTTLKIGFSQNGVQGSRYLTLPAISTAGAGVGGDPTTFPKTDIWEVKVTEIWLSGSSNVSVIAGLTTIPTARIDNSSVSPSGSNWSGSANV